MKKVVIILALMLTSSMIFAQDTPVATTPAPEEASSKFAIGIDVVYPYLWRGIRLNSNKVAFQPYLSYAFTDKFTVGLWGSTNLSSSAKDNNLSYNEFDWYASYQVSPVVKLMLSNYYYDYPTARGRYLDYSKTSTNAMDLSILLDFSREGVPLDFQWNTLISGGDLNPIGNRNYSSYTEIGYTHSIASARIDLRVFAGAIVNKSIYYVTDGLTFTNVGLNVAKEIKFSESFSLPVFVRYTYNHNGNNNKDGVLKNNFISAGITFTIK